AATISRVDSILATVTCAFARRRTSIWVTVSMSSTPFATGIKTDLLILGLLSVELIRLKRSYIEQHYWFDRPPDQRLYDRFTKDYHPLRSTAKVPPSQYYLL